MVRFYTEMCPQGSPQGEGHSSKISIAFEIENLAFCQEKLKANWKSGHANVHVDDRYRELYDFFIP